MQMGEPLAVRVGISERSPGSTTHLPRNRVEFWLPPHTATADLRQLLAGLRSQRWPDTSVLFAARTLFADPTSPLVELTGASAVLKVAPLCQEALFVGPRLLTVTTEASREQWQAVLDDAWQADPAEAISRVKWRPSRMGGRVWAAPRATGGKRRTARRVEASMCETTADEPSAAATAAGGPQGYAPRDVAELVMRVCITQSGVCLEQAAAGAALEPGRWTRVAEDDPSADPYRLRLFLRSADEGTRVQDRLHGRAIQVGVDLVTLRTEEVATTDQHGLQYGPVPGPSSGPRGEESPKTGMAPATPSAVHEQARSRIAEVISEDGLLLFVLDLVLLARRTGIPDAVLHHDVPVAQRRGAFMLPALRPGRSASGAADSGGAAGVQQWAHLPALPPAAPAPRLPRRRRLPPPPFRGAAVYRAAWRVRRPTRNPLSLPGGLSGSLLEHAGYVRTEAQTPC